MSAIPARTVFTPFAAYTWRALALGALAVAGAVGVAPPAHADDRNTGASLRLTSPSGGLWMRGKVFGPTSPAESANLGSNNSLPSWRLLGSVELPRAGGLRASGGMIGVSRRTALGNAALQENQRWDGGLTRGWLEGTRVNDTAAQASHISVPYAGVGYTNAGSVIGERGLVSNAWSFNIDLGVMALAPRSSVRLGGNPSTQDRVDDLLRELRLSPLLQIGVFYSF